MLRLQGWMEMILWFLVAKSKWRADGRKGKQQQDKEVDSNAIPIRSSVSLLTSIFACETAAIACRRKLSDHPNQRS